MNKMFLSILPVLFCVFLTKAQNVNEMPTITVTGTAEIQVVPDTATFSFTVSKKNALVATAKRENDEMIAKVTDLAKRFGIGSADMKTDYIRVSEAVRRVKIPNSDNDYEEVPDGFRVNRSLVIKLRDMSKFEAFLTALIDAGITDVDNVTFSSSEIRKFKDQARAQAIVSEIGQTIGKAVSIKEENIDRYTSPYANISSNTTVSLAEDGAGTAAVGAISVKAQVEAEFLLN